jgi:hypothetical protein
MQQQQTLVVQEDQWARPLLVQAVSPYAVQAEY